MLDGKTPTLTNPGERTLAGGGPRLLNAAAWLEALAALEAEFNTILDQDAPKITRFARRQRQDCACRIVAAAARGLRPPEQARET